MQQFKFTNAAPPFCVYDSYAFDDVIGRQCPLKFQGQMVCMSTIVDAAVAADGKSVTITVEVDGSRPEVDAFLGQFMVEL